MMSFVNKVARIFGLKITKISASAPSLVGYDNFPSESLTSRRFYNIGSGAFYHPYWTNIDYESEYYTPSQKNPFINYNLMKLEPLPIESNTAEIVYSSHTIEHVTDKQSKICLRNLIVF